MAGEWNCRIIAGVGFGKGDRGGTDGAALLRAAREVVDLVVHWTRHGRLLDPQQAQGRGIQMSGSTSQRVHGAYEGGGSEMLDLVSRSNIQILQIRQ